MAYQILSVGRPQRARQWGRSAIEVPINGAVTNRARSALFLSPRVVICPKTKAHLKGIYGSFRLSSGSREPALLQQQRQILYAG
jgi:hypothetical protein